MKQSFLLWVALLLLSFLFFLSGCETTKKEEINPAFSQYISGFTSGIVSKKSVFRIRLAQPSKKFTEANSILEDAFDFSPSIEGKAYWVDNQTIDFRPSEVLKSGQVYEIQFALDEVLTVESKYETFEYSVQTAKQTFEVKVSMWFPTRKMILYGTS